MASIFYPLVLGNAGSLAQPDVLRLPVRHDHDSGLSLYRRLARGLRKGTTNV